MTSSNPRKTLSFAEQLALLENPAPTDFDPEAPDQDFQYQSSNASLGSSGDGSGGEEDLGRAHYAAVGKSKLRAEPPLLLDPKYSGARVSRGQLYGEHASASGEDSAAGSSQDEGESGDEEGEEERGGSPGIRMGPEIPSDEDEDISSEDALGSDEERFSGFKFLGSSTTVNGVKPGRGTKVDCLSGYSTDGESATDFNGETDVSSESEGDAEERMSSESEVDEDEEASEQDGSEEEEEEEDQEIANDNKEAETKRREELRKLIQEEQKSVVANISKAIKADTEKGAAVKQQQKAFDSLLGVRIKLQKAIIATNSLPTPPDPPSSPQAVPETHKAAESAALALWNTITDLRLDLSASPSPSLKRKRDPPADSLTPTSSLWSTMQNLESTAHPLRLSTLEKWSSKTSSISTSSLTRKLNNTTPHNHNHNHHHHHHRGLTASLSETLTTGLDRHVQKTRVPRSCAPGKVGTGECVEVYDDSDFYQMLLKALVDQRMVDNSTSAASGGGIRWTTALRDAKVKKKVDTKASKGRKLRYQVQEKIQNFVAPVENNRWHKQQIDELFGSLLGQRIRVGEESEDEEDVEMDGLRLFRS